MKSKINKYKKIRELCLKDLHFFTKRVLGYNKLNDTFHREICDLLMDESNNLLMILLPRGHFKSTIATIAYPIWKCLQDHDYRVGIILNTMTNACDKTREIKFQIENNEKLHTLFPELLTERGDKWTEEKLEIFKNRAGMNIEAKGIFGSLVSKHYDLLIFDDIMDKEKSSTIEMIEKVKQKFRQSFSLVEHGRVIVIGTRWHFNDVYYYIQKNFSEEFKIICKSAYDENGEPIFKEQFTKKKLNFIRKMEGEYNFSCFYLNRPVDPDKSIFKESNFNWIDDLPKLDELNVFTLIDPAIKVKADSSYSAIVTIGMDAFENVYVIDVVRAKMRPSKLVAEILAVYNKFKPILIGIEEIGFQELLSRYIYDSSIQIGVNLPIKTLKTKNKSKEARIMRLQPKFEDGKIYFWKNARGINELATQLLQFPYSLDDTADAFAYHIDIAFKPTFKKKLPEEKNLLDRLKNLSYNIDYMEPDDFITGY